jgi:membrane protease YdiL (CAAX protease family)
LYYAILPVLVVLLVLRRNPLDIGLGPGNIRIWGLHVLITCLVAVPILLGTSRFAPFQSYYKVEDFNFLSYVFENCIYLLGWEYIFRGFLLFGLKEKFREGSILVQMVPFVLLHFGKPELETLSTIVTGIYFGYVAYRGNSFWPAFIIHLFINVFFVAVVNLV